MLNLFGASGRGNKRVSDTGMHIARGKGELKRVGNVVEQSAVVGRGAVK